MWELVLDFLFIEIIKLEPADHMHVDGGKKRE